MDSMKPLLIGSRKSSLAQVQVQEVIQELHAHHPNVAFDCLLVDTYGDVNLQVSLRTLDKTDFFTREIDQLVLSGQCRVAVHSAKDLPAPLTQGICLVALTQGKDPADSLVLRPGTALESLPSGARIATSSLRREEAVRRMRPDLTFIDLRGTIEKRLELLDNGQADGVVLAEAALIRLGLTHLNRLKLPGETVVYQGRLAVVAREGDSEMVELFSCIDSRKKKTFLYLGIDLPASFVNKKVIHCPIIRIVPRPKEHPEFTQSFKQFSSYTHLLFTSKSAVRLFFEYAPFFGIALPQLRKKICIAVGQATAELIQSFAMPQPITAERETSEGVVEVLKQLKLGSAAYLFWPRSSLSRDILTDFFKQAHLSHRTCIFYDTIRRPLEVIPDLNQVDEIVFTSPSTVDAFLKTFGTIPKNKTVSCIGPITQNYYNRLLI